MELSAVIKGYLDGVCELNDVVVSANNIHEMCSASIEKVRDLPLNNRYSVEDIYYSFIHLNDSCIMNIHVETDKGDILYQHKSKTFNKEFRVPEFLIDHYMYRMFLEVQCRGNRFGYFKYDMYGLKVNVI